MGRREYLRAIYERYQKASVRTKGAMLDEFCGICGYHRKYAIRLLAGPRPERYPRVRRPRSPRYGRPVLHVLSLIWEAAGYPWSVRLKAMLPLWLPWLRQRLCVTSALERQLLSISARQIDRRLRSRKRTLGRRLYGRTKPGTLLKHHVPIKTDRWDVHHPGFTEIDLVSHSGDRADGEFAHSFNLTDIHSTWTEARAVLGKGQTGIVAALEEVRAGLPFALQGIDSDNGSEFLNHHLVRYCGLQNIQFTRGRPYKKDDNAHIEQKNWTHVRRLLGWERYETPAAVSLINDLYRHELRLMMNLFQPSVKLIRKERVGSRLKRIYDAPQTPLDRLRSCRSKKHLNRAVIETLLRVRERTDPFDLARTIEKKLGRIQTLAARRSQGSKRVTSQMS